MIRRIISVIVAVSICADGAARDTLNIPFREGRNRVAVGRMEESAIVPAVLRVRSHPFSQFQTIATIQSTPRKTLSLLSKPKAEAERFSLHEAPAGFRETSIASLPRWGGIAARLAAYVKSKPFTHLLLIAFGAGGMGALLHHYGTNPSSDQGIWGVGLASMLPFSGDDSGRRALELARRAETSLKEGDMVEAERLARESIQWGPRLGKPHLTLAEVYKSGNKWADALQEAEEGARLLRRSRPAWHLAQYCAKQLDDEAALERICRKTIYYLPDDRVALDQLANVLRRKGHFGEAIEVARTLLAQRRGPRELITLANAIRSLNHESQEVIGLLREATTLDPQDAQAWAALATAYSYQGDDRLAWEAVQSAMRFGPEIPSTYKAMADIYLKRGKFERALEMARKAVSLGPRDSHLRPVLIMALRSLNRLDEARAETEEALKHFPNDPGLRRIRGILQWDPRPPLSMWLIRRPIQRLLELAVSKVNPNPGTFGPEVIEEWSYALGVVIEETRHWGWMLLAPVGLLTPWGWGLAGGVNLVFAVLHLVDPQATSRSFLATTMRAIWGTAFTVLYASLSSAITSRVPDPSFLTHWLLPMAVMALLHLAYNEWTQSRLGWGLQSWFPLLGSRRTASGITRIIQIETDLRSRNPDVRVSAIRALARMRSEFGYQILEDYLSGANPLHLFEVVSEVARGVTPEAWEFVNKFYGFSPEGSASQATANRLLFALWKKDLYAPHSLERYSGNISRLRVLNAVISHVLDAEISSRELSRVRAGIQAYLVQYGVGLGKALGQILPDGEEWWAFPFLEFTSFPKEGFLKRAKRLAVFSPRGSLFLLAALGPHLRKEIVRTDVEYDLPLYPILLRGFLPDWDQRLQTAERRIASGEADEEAEALARAFIGALMIPTQRKTLGLAQYRVWFGALSARLSRQRIDLKAILERTVRFLGPKRLPPEAPPSVYTWFHAELASRELESLKSWNRYRRTHLTAFHVFSGAVVAEDYRVSRQRALPESELRARHLEGYLKGVYQFLLSVRGNRPVGQESGRRVARAA